MISNINCSDVTDKNEDHHTCSEEETDRRNKCRSHVDLDNTNINALLKAAGFECRGADQFKNKTKEVSNESFECRGADQIKNKTKEVSNEPFCPQLVDKQHIKFAIAIDFCCLVNIVGIPAFDQFVQGLCFVQVLTTTIHEDAIKIIKTEN